MRMVRRGHLRIGSHLSRAARRIQWVQPQVSAFYSGIPLHEGLWNSLKKFAATAEGSRLTGARRRFL